MNSGISSNFLKIVTLAVIAILITMPAIFASNPPGGGPGCGPDPGTCSACKEEKSGGSEECDTSFNFTLDIGYARMDRTENLLTQSKFGLQEGQAGKGYYRSFDDVRNDFFQSSNTTNRVMEKLKIIAPSITSVLYSPSSLTYDTTTLAEYLKDSQTGDLRQVLTESSFVNIALITNGVGYTITTWNRTALTNMTKGTNGLYTVPTGAPISIITFRKPVGETREGVLLISKEENFSGSATLKTAKLYDQSDADVEIIRHYQGEDQNGTLLEETILTFTNRGSRPWDYTFEKVVKRATNNNGTWGSLVEVSKVKETHRDFSISTQGGDFNGKRLMSQTNAYGTAEAQTTTYEYYEDTSNLALHGRLKSVIGPDGSWEYYEFTGDANTAANTEVKYSSWKDVPFSNYQQGVKEETIIEANVANRTTTIGGQTISKKMFLTSKHSVTGNITTTEKVWDGTEWAITSTVFASQTATGPEAGRPLHTTHPDGTVTLNQYSVSGTQNTVTTLRGAGSTSAVTSGTMSVITYNQMNEVTFQETRDIASGLQLTFKTGSDFDAIGRAQKWTYNADENDYEITQYSCCGVAFTRDRSGATATYSRDALKRVYRVVSKSSSTDTPITTLTVFNGLTTTTTRTDGTTTLLLSESTRSLGDLTSVSKSPDANGDSTPEITTTVATRDTVNGTAQTSTHPDGTTSSSQSFLDGSTKTSTDQLGRTSTFDKNIHAENGGGIVTRSTAANGTQWTESYSDPLGRTYKTKFADGAQATQTYHPFTADAGSRGQTASSTDPDGNTVTFAYNTEGEQTTTTSPMPNGQQSITVSEQDVINDPFTGIAQRTRTTVNGVLISTSLSSGDGYRSKSINHLANNSISTSTRSVPNDGAWTATNTSPDGTYSVSTTTNGLTVKQEAYGSDDILIMSSEKTYDTFDRVATSIDSRTGTTTMGDYLENGAVTSFTAPGNRTTSFTYDVMGRKITTDAPDALDADGNNLSNITTTIYDAAGQVIETTGDQTYRVTYTYDAFGHQTSMTTYGTTTATTTWQYSPTRGFLLAKRDAANKGADYTYTAVGRLATRTWARSSVATPKVTTYTYDAGMMISTNYSDTTPDITITYDNFGRPITQTNGLATSTFAYDPATLDLDTETIAYNLDGQPGADFTRVIDRSHDNLLRETGWKLKDGTTIENEAAYTYSSIDGRISSISNPQLSNVSFAYGYVPNSNLIATVTSPVNTVSNVYETTRNVLSSKVNKKLDTTTVSSYIYNVNNYGQRTGVNTGGTAFTDSPSWAWGYNSKGEVVKADSSEAGLDRAYHYDGIGNRQSGGDLGSPISYAPNALNQYSAIGSLNPVHDDDGNMTSGPLPANVNANSALIWDGENRLIEAQVTSGATVNFVYDSQSRRIAESVGSATTVYVYDGWNPITEYSTTYALTKTYTWGLDLSGTMQGAGGVGGLLAVTDGTGTYYPTLDGNGNVSEYLDSNSSVVAHYEYDPFGRTTVANGSKANDFAHRFSTKPLDLSTGLYYYGYRWYDPETGRWPSRDPIEEDGGINLYGFVGNDGVNKWDYLGLATLVDPNGDIHVSGGQPKICCVEAMRVTHMAAAEQIDGGAKHKFSTWAVFDPEGTMKEFEGISYCCDPKRCVFSQEVRGSLFLGPLKARIFSTKTGYEILPDKFIDDGYTNSHNQSSLGPLFFYVTDAPGFEKQLHKSLPVFFNLEFRARFSDIDGKIIAEKSGHQISISGNKGNYKFGNSGFDK